MWYDMIHMNYNYKQLLIRSFFCLQEAGVGSSNLNSYSRDVTALTDGNLFDELSGGMSPLHQGSCPWRQIPVGLHSEHVGLDAPSRARPGGEDQLWALRGRTPGTARMDQPGGGDRPLHRIGWICPQSASYQQYHNSANLISLLFYCLKKK